METDRADKVDRLEIEEAAPKIKITMKKSKKKTIKQDHSNKDLKYVKNENTP